MSPELSQENFAALGKPARTLLQLFALFGKIKNEHLGTWLRHFDDPELPKSLQRGTVIGDVLETNSAWFRFDNFELAPGVRDFALLALLGSAQAAQWESVLHFQLLTHSRDANESRVIHRVLQRLLVLMGHSPDHIGSHLSNARAYYVSNSFDASVIANAMPMLIAPNLFDRMHVSFQVVLLTRRLNFNLIYPRESITDWGQHANAVYREGVKLGASGTSQSPDYAQHLLVLHTAFAMCIGGDKPHEINDVPWLALSWDGYSFLNSGHIEDAVRCFELAQKNFRARLGRRTVMGGLFGVLHFLALYAKGDAAAWKLLSPMLKLKVQPSRTIHGEYSTHELYGAWVLQGYGQHLLDPGAPFEPGLDTAHASMLDFMLVGILMRWKGVENFGEPFKGKLEEFAAHSQKSGLAWLARQLRAALMPNDASPEQTLVSLKAQVAPWQDLLKALAETDKKAVSTRVEATSRLQICLSQARDENWFAVHLAELRIAKDGKFGEAKPIKNRVGLKNVIARLSDEQDLRVANVCMREADFLSAHFADSPAEKRGFWADLIGHPEVYFWPPGTRGQEGIRLQPSASQARHVSVVLGQLELKISADKAEHAKIELRPKVDLVTENFGLSFAPAAANQSAGDASAVLNVIDISPAQRRVMAMLAKGIAIPNSALPQMVELTAQPGSPVKLSMDASTGAIAQSSDATPHVLLEPNANGLSVILRVRPFGKDVGPYFAPAEGERRVLGVINSEMRAAERDFRIEAAGIKALLEQLPTLVAALEAGGIVLDPEAALDLLAELQNADPAPVLAWPKGKARRVITAGKFAVQAKAGRDWLGIEGTLELSEGTIKLSELIGLLESSRGRYLTLDGERFIQLSDSLRKRVQSLANFSDARGKVEVPMLAGAVLAQQLGIEHSDGIKLAAKKMAEAATLAAALPATLQAELRDYQIAGFRWLMQMAHWGAGACLADDMGLGKTVQALTLLLARASGGAAIVMAPTSVIGNWQREAARFAPTLNVVRFDALDRSAELPTLAAFDLLLVSYGLLTTHAESLSKPHFHTIILDEAQAIKNATTQRAQAACALQGDFRVATTGTPLENHLGELWSLMRFLNPGLLSSQEKFQRRFSGPIERDPASPAKSVLRQLIAPFLLRRTKAQVLSELPPKTEITLTITPSSEEAQLVQGLRAAAMAKLNNLDQATAEKRFHILAEITRLRRAACHPDLVAPELKIGSAKLTQLLELVAELKENRHRALIFSQFVDYLSIVRKALDDAGFSYQYLDGSTPTKAREAAVSAFQAGTSDVFLLSLKAGGVGLNLTAADYVIHLDPWWNPAVEQQASDRVHRIGQTRPVTIYRLVLAGSIEEQILSLHGQKRELIDSMLSERETAKPVNADELLALIAGK